MLVILHGHCRQCLNVAECPSLCEWPCWRIHSSWQRRIGFIVLPTQHPFRRTFTNYPMKLILRSVRRLSVVVPHNASKVLCRSSCQNKHRDRKKPSKDRVHLLRAQLRRFQCHSGSAMACPPLPPAVCCAFPYPIAILLLGWFLREYAVHSRLPIQQILFAPFVNGVCAFLSLEG